MQVKPISFHERIAKRPTKVKDIYRLLFIPLPYYFQGFDKMTKTTCFEKDYKNLLKDIKAQRIRAKDLYDLPEQSKLQNYNPIEMLTFADNLMYPPKDRLLKKYQCILFYKILIEPFVKSFPDVPDKLLDKGGTTPPAPDISDDSSDNSFYHIPEGLFEDLPFN